MITPEIIRILLLMLAIILIITGVLIEVTTPTFYKMDKGLKKLEKQIKQRKCYINMDNVKHQTDSLFKTKKIDGFEREYLFKRIEHIENWCNRAKETGPKYAAGGPEDKVGYHH